MTETARFADVVLPAATWGEKTGTFTNADRTVHLSEQAVEPPGEARADLEIFLDYARRMDFRDRDGEPLIAWHDAEGAFEAWKACSKGRPCDYSGMTLRPPARIQRHPVAVHRGCARRDRAALHGRRVQHRPSYCGDVRAGPETGAPYTEERVPRQGARTVARSCTRAATPPPPSSPAPSTRCCSPPAAPSTTSTRAPRPAARPQLAGSGARRVGRAQPQRRRRRSGSRRATWCGSSLAARRDRGTGAHQRHPAGRGLRAVPLRLLGCRRRGLRRTVRPAARPTS